MRPGSNWQSRRPEAVGYAKKGDLPAVAKGKSPLRNTGPDAFGMEGWGEELRERAGGRAKQRRGQGLGALASGLAAAAGLAPLFAPSTRNSSRLLSMTFCGMFFTRRRSSTDLNGPCS